MKSLVLCTVLALASLVSPLAADPIEDRFEARGPLATFSDLSTGPGGDFSIFRPATPGVNGLRHPVITWGNGTFAVPLIYFELLDHLASYGFVVIASNSPFTGSGVQMLEGVDWILEENENPASPLFGTINTAAIGATGHSQGGGGAINAGKDERLRCTAPIEPITVDPVGLNGPTFLIAGEDDNIIPAEDVAETIYVPSQVTSIFGVRAGADHFDALGGAALFRGYVTAWFAFCLADSNFARGAFVPGGSLEGNPDWLVFRKPAS